MSWFFLWNFFVYETPETHPTITQEEKQLILASRPEKDASRKVNDFVALKTSLLCCQVTNML